MDIEAGYSGSQNDAPSSKNAYDVWKVLIITYDHIIKSSSTMTHGMWHDFVPGKTALQAEPWFPRLELYGVNARSATNRNWGRVEGNENAR